jgi:hypothetical protein
MQGMCQFKVHLKVLSEILSMQYKIVTNYIILINNQLMKGAHSQKNFNNQIYSLMFHLSKVGINHTKRLI